jgi:septal ring factor EnvC (AmiA/AmiB activator)
LILDHGDGYMSLYGHNETLLKEVGEWASAGEQIATVGNSGGQTQVGLYFEIRHKGKPQNPQPWLKS